MSLCNWATRVSEQWTGCIRPEDLILNARPREHLPPRHVSIVEGSRTDQKQLSFSQEAMDPFCCVTPTTPALAFHVDAIVVFKRRHFP